MAKEIFLLEYNELLPKDSRQRDLGRYAEHLQKLGVGSAEFQPMIFSPSSDPYASDAEFMAAELGSTLTYTTDFIKPHWPIPFVNGNQANACIIGTIAHTLHQEDAKLDATDPAQMIVLAQPALSQEFLRLNPNGVSKDHFNTGDRSGLFSRYFIQHVKLG